MLLLYGLTVFGSALLLFFIQPMFARIVLPLLGGTPAVWTTTQVFCEGVLLGGYLYAHASTRWFSIRSQILVHLAIMVFALLILPIRVPSGWNPPVEANPVLWLLALLAVSIGLPFFVISGSSPLLQRWFAHLSHRESQDPYFLYAASNMGSMAALFAYPAVAEPWLRLGVQTWAWAAGYCLLIVLTASCALLLWKAQTRTTSGVQDPPGAGKTSCVDASANCSTFVRPSLARRFRWLLLAFVPCSLMLSVTTYLTTDIASVPLLWIVPLCIYLLSYILVFARREIIPHRVMLRLMPLLVLPLAVALAGRGTDPIVVAIPMHLAALFVISMVCHGELAKDRPSVSHLTEFYVYLSAGGFLGGIFNALIAPAVFNSVAEYPIVLAISCTLLPWDSSELWKLRSQILDIVAPLLLTLATVFLVYSGQQMHLKSVPLERTLMFGIPAIVCFSFSRRRLRLALAVGGILWAGNFYRGEEGRALYAERSFFGVSRVTVDDSGKLHQFRNGTTLHGSQRIDPVYRKNPTSYYCRTGPLGQFFDSFQKGVCVIRSVAVVGLGVGEITAYAQPGQKWTYFEIDPTVLRIARDAKYFSYLRDSQAALEVILGDGRLKLEDAPDGSYDVLILDAYSSDSVPVHLIDREALQLYLRKIGPHGKLLFHISNRYLDLEPVLGNLAVDAGLHALAQSDDTFDPSDLDNDKKPSAYVVLGRSKEDLHPLEENPRWAPIRIQPDLGVWTDDFSSVLRVMRWNMPVSLRGKAY